MPAGLAPLCPTCLDRALAWTAGSCPSCQKSSPVAGCDSCQKSRAGAFVPEDPKRPGADGGAQRFICVDCMEKLLESDVSDLMRNAALAVILAVVAVRFASHPAFTYALFAASAACLVAWWLGADRRRAPAKHVGGVWRIMRRGIERALKKRRGA